MKPALPAVLLLALLGGAVALPRAAAASWLVLVGGKRIQTEGAWTLKGDLLTVHETTGRILTVATSTVDAAACRKLNDASLRIEAVPVAPLSGAVVTLPPIPAIASAGATPPPVRRAAAPGGKAATMTAKQARQAQLRRELRYKQIVDGCAQLFIVDQVDFKRCVEVQTRAAAP